MQKDALSILQQPRTSILDNHTKIFIMLSKQTVVAGRALAVLPSDIKKPFPKKIIVSSMCQVCREEVQSICCSRRCADGCGYLNLCATGKRGQIGRYPVPSVGRALL